VPWGFGGIIVAVVGTEVAVMKQSPKSDRVGGKVGEKLDEEVQLPLQFVFPAPRRRLSGISISMWVSGCGNGGSASDVSAVPH